MVVDGPSDQKADQIFRALADRTRRDIVVRVLSRDESVSALAGRYAMSFAAVQKHVAVLERAGLVTKERHGREQHVRGDVHAVRQAATLLDAYERVWRQRIGQVDQLLAEDERS
ncbi:ArsR family transcriptional regulator [Georgenia halophila]